MNRKMLFVTLIVLMSLVLGLAGCGTEKESTEINVLCTPQEEWCQGMKQEFEDKYRHHGQLCPHVQRRVAGPHPGREGQPPVRHLVGRPHRQLCRGQG